MKKLFCIILAGTLTTGVALAQQKRPPVQELKAQGKHVESSGNDLLHLRFKRAHEKHLAEARRRNRGIAKDLRGEGQPLPKPPAPRRPL